MKRTKQSTFAKRERQEQGAGFAPVGGAQFTPGPWRVDGEGMQVYKDKQPIAVIRTVFDENGGRVTREANAALIAAAPAMYEELGKCVSLIRALQERLNAHGEMCNFDEEEIASAIAALAQAEGKQ